MIQLEPIGYIQTSSKEKADVPRQGTLALGNKGIIRCLPKKNFEQALEDLEGIERIWILSWMNQIGHWKAKVQPPRSVGKKGVFATRSPHRPNPIGLSCVKLIRVQGLDLHIEDHDLLDKTPILDIKPYLPYADSFSEVKLGWMEEEVAVNRIFWKEEALQVAKAISLEVSIDLKQKIEDRLRFFIQPTSSNRVKRIKEDLYLQAYKYWRIVFKKSSTEDGIYVLTVLQAYDTKDLDSFYGR